MSLNWKELEKQVFELKPLLLGAILQKIAQTNEVAGGEAVVFSLYSREEGGFRLFSGMSGNEAFLGILPDDCPTDAATTSNSFIMLLRKYCIGAVITEIHQIQQDRAILFHLSNQKFLLFELIPRRSNILFLKSWDNASLSGKCIASFKKVSLSTGATHQLPPTKVFEPKEVRNFSEINKKFYHERVFRFFWNKLNSEKFLQKKQAWLQLVKGHLKKISLAIENTQKDVATTHTIDNLKKQALLLSAHLYELGAQKFPSDKKISLEDFESGEKIEISVDPQKKFSENSELLFKKIKKLERGKEEISARMAELEKKKKNYQKVISILEETSDMESLEKTAPLLEKYGVISSPQKNKQRTGKNKKKNEQAEAKPFLEVQSSDGFRILCGRNQIENRAVTFKESMGSDVWMHVKGTPGAHVVIKMQKNKTVPLNTLLEAAQLALYYSKIRSGKKADIDYTFRKNVKPIKGTLAEVSYTDNKTLYVEADGEKLKKVLREG